MSANPSALLQIDAHYAGLKNRPDYYGYVSISEGVNWAKANPNALANPTPENTLYLDASKLGFGNISVGRGKKMTGIK